MRNIFKRRTKEVLLSDKKEVPPSDKIDDTVEELKVLGARMKAQVDFHVTKRDFLEAVAEAAADSFPQIKEHPVVKAFWERWQQCEDARKIVD